MTFLFKNTGEIRGRLVQDSNRDFTENTNTPGVFEAGLAGQTVQLLDGHGRVVATATTDSHGGYSFTKLAGGDYFVRVPTTVNGQTLAPKDVGSDNEDSDANANGVTDRIHLPSGGRQLQVDFVYGTYSDGVVDGEETGEVMGVGYDDSNAPTNGGGDRITDGADVILGNGGNDTISAGGGNDTVFGGTGNDNIRGEGGNDLLSGDGTISTAPTSVTPGAVAGANQTVLVWELDQLSVNSLPGNDNPFPNNTSGDNDVVGSSFTLFPNATPTAVGIIDGDSRFDDGDTSQVLSQNVNLNGVNGGVNHRLTPEYAYSVQSSTGQIINIYVVELNGNNAVGFVSDAPLLQGETYTFLARTTTDPSVNYSQLATSYLVPTTTTDAGFGGTGNDTLDGGEGNDTLIGGGGDDKLLGGAGNDRVEGGTGRDSIDGGIGDDTLLGGAGNDTIEGGAGNDLIDGGAGGGTTTTVTRESFNWEAVSQTQADSTVSQVTGNVTVTYTRTADTGAHESEIASDILNVAGINGGGAAIDTNSSLSSVTNGQGNTGAFQWTFSQAVGNLQFNVNDLDGDGLVTIRAFDASGNPIPVTLQGGAGIALVNTDAVPGADTGDAIGPYVDVNNPSATVQVTIPGPVARVEVIHTQNGSDNSGINITDLFFDVTTTTGGAGDTGADVLFGGAGNDTILGDAGNDTIIGGSGDQIRGGADADSIVIDPSALDALGGRGTGITVDGGATGVDNDTLDLRNYTAFRNLVQTNDPDGNSTSGRVDVIDATGGVRTVTFTEIENLLLPPPEDLRDGVVDGLDSGEVMNVGYTDAQGDRITDGADSIRGNGGNDTITAGGGNDSVDAGAGDDRVDGGLGDDRIDGGIGNDTLSGGIGNDLLNGGTGNDQLGGAEGDDTLLGGAGRDTLTGGSGNDALDGGAEDDTINGNSGNDAITDLDGNNLIVSGIDGSPDRGLPFVGSPDADPFDDRDTITTGNGNDTILSGDDRDVINAGGGNNVIDAGFDNDSVTAGDGNDLIFSGEGSDTINAGGGNDTIFGGENVPAVNLIDVNVNPANNDPILDNGDDLIDAGAGDDLVFGEDDNDTILGGAGNDTLDGGIDNDVIDGGAGNDLIIGGQGADSLSGGLGNDTFAVGNFADPVFGGTYREGLGDTIVGGEDPSGNDIDVLDLTGNVNFDIFFEDSIDPTGTSGESGRVVFFTDATKTVVQGQLVFKEIEEFAGPICFTPGTLIATPRGEVPVETLREGDKVITRDNGIQEIRWVGTRTLDRAELAENPHFKPILVKKGSLGNGLPERDMVVSPQHRLLVANETTELYFNETEVLVPAKHLVNKWGISKLETLRTTYIHFMCDRHEVVLSNGSWTESFQPGQASMTTLGEDVRNEILALFPELKTHEGMESYVAARRSLKAHEAKLLQL